MSTASLATAPCTLPQTGSGSADLVSCQASSVAAHLPSPRRALLQALPMPLDMSCSSRLALHADGGAVVRHLTLDATQAHSAGLQDIPELADMASFELLLSRELSVNRRAGTRLAVLLVDFEAVLASSADAGTEHLENFRQILGQRLRARVRSSDAVMRIGPQRFAVLLQNVGRADIHPIQTRLYDGLLVAYPLGWPLQSVQLFMGWAKYVNVSSTAAELIAATELISGRSVAKADWQKVQAPQVQDLHSSPRSLNTA